jgi:hypothetical protein
MGAHRRVHPAEPRDAPFAESLRIVNFETPNQLASDNGKEHVMRKQFLGLCLALATFAAGASGTGNKWRIEFSGNAESAGRIVLELTPTAGEPIRATADIPKGLGENHVARSVRDALQAAAGARYDIEVDDGEDVLVKKRDGERNFIVTVVANSVQGVKIDADPE